MALPNGLQFALRATFLPSSWSAPFEEEPPMESPVAQVALDLTKLVVETEKAAGRDVTRRDVYQIYNQCFRRTVGLRNRFDPMS